MSKKLAPTGRIEQCIIVLRGQRVMLSPDLAKLYDVKPKALVQAVKRNSERFPDDFMFQLTWDEVAHLRSRSVASNERSARGARSQVVTLRRGRNVKYAPYAFTERGVTMLSSVLRSERAVRVNIEIMRAFLRLRALAFSYKDLANKIRALEAKYDAHDARTRPIFEAIRDLMEPPEDAG